MISGEDKRNPPPYETTVGAGSGQTNPPPIQASDLPTPTPFPPGYPSGKHCPYVPAPQGGVPAIHFLLPPSFVASPYYPRYPYYELPTGRYVESNLPPDSPQMLCLIEGRHLNKTSFGLLGILAAVIWFPIGIVCCLCDRRVVCKRCGALIDGGISC